MGVALDLIVGGGLLAALAYGIYLLFQKFQELDFSLPTLPVLPTDPITPIEPVVAITLPENYGSAGVTDIATDVSAQNSQLISQISLALATALSTETSTQKQIDIWVAEIAVLQEQIDTITLTTLAALKEELLALMAFEAIAQETANRCYNEWIFAQNQLASAQNPAEWWSYHFATFGTESSPGLTTAQIYTNEALANYENAKNALQSAINDRVACENDIASLKAKKIAPLRNEITARNDLIEDTLIALDVLRKNISAYMTQLNALGVAA